MEKAFDSVWRDGLLVKMHRLGITGNVWHWITDFMAARKAKCFLMDRCGPDFTTYVGLPQGSVISPILFNIFLQDIYKQLSCQKVKFADDGTIWSTGKDVDLLSDTIQQELQKVLDWTQKWRMKLSPDKTEICLFSKGSSNNHIPRIHLDGTEIKYNSTPKILGLHLDESLSFQTHISKTEQKASKALGVLRQIKHVEKIKTSKLVQIYKTVICPILEYACPVWQIADCKRLEDIQRKALNLCLDSYASSGREALEVELGVKPLQIRRQELAIREGAKIVSKDCKVLIKKCWLDWNENIQTERFISPFGKIQLQLEDLHSETGTTVFNIEPEFSFQEGLQPSKRRPEYWNRLGCSKSRSAEQQKESRSLIQNLMDNCSSDSILAFTDGSCQPNPESATVLARKLAHATKGLRQDFIKKDPNSFEASCSAAIEVQRIWRGYRTRTSLHNLVEPGISTTAVYSGSKHHFMRQDDFVGYDQYGKEKPAGRMRLENYYTDFVRRLMANGLERNQIPSFEDFCANYIQDWWRDLQEKRKRRGKLKLQKKQRVEQHAPVPVKKPVVIPTVREAACRIQRAWRRHIDIQVYRYYRDLINFKTRGNPSLMLKCINPTEAKLLDPAAGIHIKFRLAGERFPPNIYYKIFTHRPIQDMCSNSPKDYTKAEVKLRMTRDQHNTTKTRPLPGQDDHRGWYKREDNNGWRLVSDRLIHHIMADSVTWESSQKKYEYHHDKLQRRQDVEKRKKKKKIQWMQKMYKDGMLKAKSDDKETIQLIEGAAAGMVATVENYGYDALEDWEVDELLDWTTSLNFEDYQNSWKELATSANSEKQVEDKMRLLTSTADPYELTLSTGPSRYQSTQQSRNTPASGTSSPVGPGRGQVAVS